MAIDPETNRYLDSLRAVQCLKRMPHVLLSTVIDGLKELPSMTDTQAVRFFEKVIVSSLENKGITMTPDLAEVFLQSLPEISQKSRNGKPLSADAITLFIDDTTTRWPELSESLGFPMTLAQESAF